MGKGSRFRGSDGVVTEAADAQAGDFQVIRDQVEDPVTPNYLPHPPSDPDDGIDVAGHKVVDASVRLRSNPLHYRGHARVATVSGGDTYSLNLGSSTASYTESGGGETGILNGLARAGNALTGEAIYCEALDLDDDGNVDTLRAEGGWTQITPAASAKNFTVTARTSLLDTTDFTLSYGSEPTGDTVLRDMKDEINNNSSRFEAKISDHDDDGSAEILYVAPRIGLQHVTWSTGSNLSVDVQGDSTSFTFSEGSHTGSADLHALKDATSVTFWVWVCDQGGQWDVANNGKYSIANNWRERISSINQATRVGFQVRQADGAVGLAMSPI